MPLFDDSNPFENMSEETRRIADDWWNRRYDQMVAEIYPDSAQTVKTTFNRLLSYFKPQGTIEIIDGKVYGGWGISRFRCHLAKVRGFLARWLGWRWIRLLPRGLSRELNRGETIHFHRWTRP